MNLPIVKHSSHPRRSCDRVLRRAGPGRDESERAGRERAKPGRDERARPVRASVPRSWRPPMPIPTAAPRQGAALPLFSTQAPDKVSGLFHAGTILARLLEMGRALDAKLLRGALEEAFGASDAEGAWVWKDAYEAEIGRAPV